MAYFLRMHGKPKMTNFKSVREGNFPHCFGCALRERNYIYYNFLRSPTLNLKFVLFRLIETIENQLELLRRGKKTRLVEWVVIVGGCETVVFVTETGHPRSTNFVR